MYKKINDKGMYYYFRREVKNYTLSSGTSPYRPCKGVPPELPSTTGWKPMKMRWKICEIPCDKKTPCEKPCEFCTA